MHFSKTYAQLLSTLPPEFRQNAFEYRKLKRLINEIVFELDSLGLGPSVLQGPTETHAFVHPEDELDGLYRHATIAYEIALNSTVPEPRLRLSSTYPCDAGMQPTNSTSETTSRLMYHVDLPISEQLLSQMATALIHPPVMDRDNILLPHDRVDSDHLSDLIIPLHSDTAFFQLLTDTLSSLSGQSDALLNDFNSALATLAENISVTARPVSSSNPESFSAYSLSANNVMALAPSQKGKSDLYTWREILRVYAEVQVFEGIRESAHGERDIKDVEKQLKLFEGLIQDKKASLVFPTSKDALDEFLSLNVFVLDVKKFQHANSEAIRKILKKHAKRTTFPIPFYPLEQGTPASTLFSRQLASISRPSNSLPKLLVQAIGETLLPIVPHIDDYSCLICTYIAFKPIRLSCGHFFCVRCLAKLQRRGKADCPLCRAPTVLKANPSNLDYGLLNFIADWFPRECREKRCADERELTQEQLDTLGISDMRTCRIM